MQEALKVAKYNKPGFLEGTYKSLESASESTGIPAGDISSAIKGQCSVKGYIWKIYPYNLPIPERIPPITSIVNQDNVFGDDDDEEIDDDGKGIIRYGRGGKLIKVYSNSSKASEDTGDDEKLIIKAAVYGGMLYGYQWRFKSDTDDVIKDIGVYDIKNKKVLQYDLEGNYMREYDNYYIAAENVGISYTAVRDCIRGLTRYSKGFQWKFKPIYGSIEKNIGPIKDEVRTQALPVIETKVRSGEVINHASIAEARRSLLKKHVAPSMLLLRRSLEDGSEFLGSRWKYEDKKNVNSFINKGNKP